ncbi:hypothetical protein [Actinomadura kijaniata]|nr:hypothetical protein [Actinomadura kijaniata]
MSPVRKLEAFTLALAEIEHCAHFPMHSHPPRMWARITDLVSRADFRT